VVVSQHGGCQCGRHRYGKCQCVVQWSFEGGNIIANESHAVTVPSRSPSARASPLILAPCSCHLCLSKVDPDLSP
jgi:hypothetical protein